MRFLLRTTVLCFPLLWLGACGAGTLLAETRLEDSAEPAVRVAIQNSEPQENAGFDLYLSDDSAHEEGFRPVSLLQPQPLLTRTQEVPTQTPLPSVAAQLRTDLFGSGTSSFEWLAGARRNLAAGLSSDAVFGSDAKIRVSTDTGSLLSKSPSVTGIEVQSRTPIVSEPRIRSGRIGGLAASGSYWVPARMDLDTMVSKLDSRIVNDVVVIKGPYSAMYGPGFQFLDVDLLHAPRYEDGFEAHGRTSADYKTNGQQFYGRQEAWGGAEDWGFRVGYGHRTGNDYRSGSGIEIPASYNSRDVDLAVGFDLTPDSSLEFGYVRLDQTGVEFPGQAFDIDVLVTNGFELKYTQECQPAYERLVAETWYNRTRLDGSAQSAGKRRQFPYYDVLTFRGITDVDSQSTGYSCYLLWGDDECGQLTAGTDLRYVKQKLNEITSGRLRLNVWKDANSPIPESDACNPGLFAEIGSPLGEHLRIKAGARVDLVSANVLEDPAKLSSLGTLSTPLNPISLADILGTDQFDQDFRLWSVYVMADYELNCCWTAQAACGYAQRPPNLTEMYAAQTFMFVLQNGLNTVTGDPRLAPERLLQIDLGLRYDVERLHGVLTGYYAWAFDYITFENLAIARGAPNNQVEQVQLKFVNTDLATFCGAELHAEYDLTEALVLFGNLSYVEATDRTRNGDFATAQATPGNPSQRVYGLPRGYFSGVPGPAEEPLPAISPLTSRLGVRLRDPVDHKRYGLEISTRLVHSQTRVATSLLETATPGFNVWDLRGYWQANRQLLLIAGVENFANANYREHLDFRSPDGIQMFQPGVNFYAGGEVNY